MSKKVTLSLLLSFLLLFSALPVYASGENATSLITHDSVSFFEIDDVELQQRVLESATRVNVNLDLAQITIYENGVIVFLTTSVNAPFSNGYVEEYGLYEYSPNARSGGRPSNVATPSSYAWSFSGSANSGNTLFTARYVTGRLYYDVVVNNTSNRIITARTRRIGALSVSVNLNTSQVPAGGQVAVTGITPNGTSCRVYMSFASGPLSVNGSITGRGR